MSNELVLEKIKHAAFEATLGGPNEPPGVGGGCTDVPRLEDIYNLGDTSYKDHCQSDSQILVLSARTIKPGTQWSGVTPNRISRIIIKRLCYRAPSGRRRNQ
ncbi:hypothetical protein ACJJTC_010953 [Scirpophaga incertulas]